MHVGEVPQAVGLGLERLDQMRMGVAERVDRDACGKIQIALAFGGFQPDAMPAFETIGTRLYVS